MLKICINFFLIINILFVKGFYNLSDYQIKLIPQKGILLEPKFLNNKIKGTVLLSEDMDKLEQWFKAFMNID